mgnify:CR=1 FL=1
MRSAATSTRRSPPVTLESTSTPFRPRTSIASNSKGENPVASKIKSNGPWTADVSISDELRVLK